MTIDDDRYRPLEVDPTQLVMRDADGDFVHLFRFSAARRGCPGDEPSAVDEIIEVNAPALRALVQSPRPVLFVLDQLANDAGGVPTEPLRIEFETVGDPDGTWGPVLDPLAVQARLAGALLVHAHTDLKWVVADTSSIIDRRVSRYLLARVESVAGAFMSRWVTPYSFAFFIPKLLRDQTARVLDDVKLAVEDARAFAWRMRTVVRYDP